MLSLRGHRVVRCFGHQRTHLQNRLSNVTRFVSNNPTFDLMEPHPDEKVSPSTKKLYEKWYKTINKLDKVFHEDTQMPVPDVELQELKAGEMSLVPVNLEPDIKLPFEDDYLNSNLTPEIPEMRYAFWETQKINPRLPSFPFSSGTITVEGEVQYSEDDYVLPMDSPKHVIQKKYHLQTFGDIQRFIADVRHTFLSANLIENPQVNYEAIDKSGGVPGDFPDYLRSLKKPPIKFEKFRKAVNPLSLRPSPVYWSADFTSIEIPWLQELDKKLKPDENQQDSIATISASTNILSNIAKKENLDITLHNESRDDIRDLAHWTSAYSVVPDASDQGLFAIMKFTGVPPRNKKKIGLYQNAERYFQEKMMSRSFGRAVYDVPLHEEDEYLDRFGPPENDLNNVLIAGSPYVSKRFDFKRLGLIQKILAQEDEEFDGPIRWMASYFSRKGEHLYKVEKQIDWAKKFQQINEWVKSGGIFEPEDEELPEIPTEVDWDTLELAELQKRSENIPSELKNVHMNVVIRGIPKGTTVEEFYFAFRPLIFQNMNFSQSPKKDFFEVSLENIPTRDALLFKHLQNVSIKGSVLEVLPVVPKEISSDLSSQIYGLFGVKKSEAHTALIEKFSMQEKIRNSPKEFGFFVQAPAGYTPSYDDFVISNEEFQRRKLSLTQDWETPIPTTSKISSESNSPWIFCRNAGYWHLSWPRKYPGHNWKKSSRSGNSKIIRESTEEEEITYTPNWNIIGNFDAPLEDKRARAITQRILFMNKNNSLINLFGGPEVSCFRELSLIGSNAFIIGVSHPPLDLYCTQIPKPNTLNRGGLRTIPIPKNFPTFEDYEQFLEKNFSQTSSFPMERQRWTRCIRMSLSDYFEIPLSRVVVSIKPEGSDDEIVNTRSLIFVRIKDTNLETRAVDDQYVPGLSQYFPYKSRRTSIYEQTDAHDYKYDELDFTNSSIGRNFGDRFYVHKDDNEVTRASVEFPHTDSSDETKYVMEHAAEVAEIKKKPPMYTKTVYNKKTGTKKSTLVLVPDAFAYYATLSDKKSVKPEDMESAKFFWEKITDKKQWTKPTSTKTQ